MMKEFAPGYYVDENGQCYSARIRGTRKLDTVVHQLKPQITYRGYYRITYCKDRQPQRKTISRLVLEQFVGPCPTGCEACHNDNDKSNNRLTNLRWDTRVRNMRDKIRHGTERAGERHYAHRLNHIQVSVIRHFCSFQHRRGHLAYLGRVFHVHRNTIRHVMRNETWKSVAP